MQEPNRLESGSKVWLLCDLGNSCLKAGLVWGTPSDPSPEFEPLVEITHKRGESWDPIRRFLDGKDIRPNGIAVSSVAESTTCDSLLTALQRPGFPPVVVNPESGLELRVRHTETVGLDRLYAARGAFWRVDSTPAIVVDAGTALTVDAVVQSKIPGQAAFLGGAIAPGPSMLAKALGAGGAQLHTIQTCPGAHALGRETQEALASGVVVGFEGAALHLVERIAEEAGLEQPPVVLTGGAGDFLEPIFRRRFCTVYREPHMVPMGLWLAVWEGSS
ncbi:MAG: type III pantothenate kinase [bacterium]|nr:type III pantothenate kinase [bacterium]